MFGALAFPLIAMAAADAVRKKHEGQCSEREIAQLRQRQAPVQFNRVPHNCVNCGAPPEPVCSYCGTKA